MPEHYSESPAPAPAPASKPKRESKKLTDKQKADLNKHMAKSGLTGSEAKSHRMKMMSRMRNKNMSVNKAHKDIMGK
jgi:hypothetical protein